MESLSDGGEGEGGAARRARNPRLASPENRQYKVISDIAGQRHHPIFYPQGPAEKLKAKDQSLSCEKLNYKFKCRKEEEKQNKAGHHPDLGVEDGVIFNIALIILVLCLVFLIVYFGIFSV